MDALLVVGKGLEAGQKVGDHRVYRSNGGEAEEGNAGIVALLAFVEELVRLQTC